MYIRSVWWRGGYGRINGRTRALDVAIVSREATLDLASERPFSKERALARRRPAMYHSSLPGGEARHDTCRWSVASGAATR
jgi:hypothetical protein